MLNKNKNLVSCFFFNSDAPCEVWKLNYPILSLLYKLLLTKGVEINSFLKYTICYSILLVNIPSTSLYCW